MSFIIKFVVNVCFVYKLIRKKDVRTNTRTSYSLRSVATWTSTMVTASGILTDLVVSALMSAVSALIDVYRPQETQTSIN